MNKIQQKNHHIDVIPRIVDTSISGTYTKKPEPVQIQQPQADIDNESICESIDIQENNVNNNSLWQTIKYYSIPLLFVISIIIIIYILYKFYTSYYKKSTKVVGSNNLLESSKIEVIEDNSNGDTKDNISEKSEANKYIIDEYSDSENEENEETEETEETEEDNIDDEYVKSNNSNNSNNKNSSKQEYNNSSYVETYINEQGDIKSEPDINLDDIQELLDSEDTKEFDISMFDEETKEDINEVENVNEDLYTINEDLDNSNKIELLSEAPTPSIKSRRIGRPKKKT